MGTLTHKKKMSSTSTSQSKTHFLETHSTTDKKKTVCNKRGQWIIKNGSMFSLWCRLRSHRNSTEEGEEVVSTMVPHHWIMQGWAHSLFQSCAWVVLAGKRLKKEKVTLKSEQFLFVEQIERIHEYNPQYFNKKEPFNEISKCRVPLEHSHREK